MSSRPHRCQLISAAVGVNAGPATGSSVMPNALATVVFAHAVAACWMASLHAAWKAFEPA